MRYKIEIVVLCIAMFVLGWFVNAHIQAANAQAINPTAASNTATEKIYQYKVEACGSGDAKAVGDCLNSMAKDGWRVNSPFGTRFVIFER